MSPAANAEMMAVNNAKPDWRGTCKECGLTITGSPETFQQHAEEHRRGA